MNATVEHLPAVQVRKPTEIRVVTDPIPMLDTARFEHMQRIAGVMARSSLVPETLRSNDIETAVANCFLVVNQAVRWNMDPFAVAQCAFVLKGKIGYEGKLVAAVLEGTVGQLDYEFTGTAPNRGIKISGRRSSDGKVVSIEGTVAKWKTENGNWLKDPDSMLIYRGTRQWARLYQSGVMLGVYTRDELEEMATDVRSSQARDITPPDDDGPPPPSAIEHKPQQTPELVAGETMDAATGEVTWDEPPAPDDGVPGFLDRRKSPPTVPNADEQQWLADLTGAFSGCEDMITFGQKQRDVMAPFKSKVSPEMWLKAQHLAEDTFRRIQAAA